MLNYREFKEELFANKEQFSLVGKTYNLTTKDIVEVIAVEYELFIEYDSDKSIFNFLEYLTDILIENIIVDIKEGEETSMEESDALVVASIVLNIYSAAC